MVDEKDLYYWLSRNKCPFCYSQLIKDAITGEIYCSKCGVIFDIEDYYNAFDIAEREIFEKEKDIALTIPKEVYYKLSKITKKVLNDKESIKRNYEYSKNWLKSFVLNRRLMSSEMLDLILLDYKKFYYNKIFFNQKSKKQMEWFAGAYLYLKVVQFGIPITPYEIFKAVNNNRKFSLQNFINYVKIFADYYDIDLDKIDENRLLKNYLLRFYILSNDGVEIEKAFDFINKTKLEDMYSIFEIPLIAFSKLKSFAKIDKKKLKDII